VTKVTPTNLEKLIAFTKAEDWALDSYALADWLWLWQIKCDRLPFVEEQERKTPKEGGKDKKREEGSKNTKTDSTGDNKDNSLPVTVDQTKRREDNPQNPQTTKQDRESDTGLPISVPDTAILRNTLELNRKARPLIRKVSSATVTQIDIPKTVQETAEISLGRSQLLIIPTYQAQPIRALDAILLVETHPSMLLWRGLQEEIWEWMIRLGAFRDVRLCGLSYEAGKVRISSSLQKKETATLTPESLVEPRGQRIIFVLSDGTSPAWYSGAYNAALKKWGSQQIVCLLTPFPETLWHRTALKQGMNVAFHNTQARRPNQQWQIAPEDLPAELEFRFDTKEKQQKYLKDCLRLPVLNLTPTNLVSWAGVIDGDPDCRCAGFLLDVPTTPSLISPKSQTKGIINLEEVQNRINVFRKNAYPTAWQLMQRLSAVPINLAVMRLIQRKILPESRPTDLAEVLFSGLLVPYQKYDFYTHPDRLSFDFVDSARQLLREELGLSRAFGVVHQLSEFIADKFGLTLRQFEARLLTSPHSFVGKDGQLVEAFARITADLFERSGNTEIAEQLKQSQQLLESATQARKERQFLTQFTQQTTPIEIGRLTILEGQDETQFNSLREQCANLKLEDGDLYELQQTAIELGIEEQEAQTLFIYNEIANQLDLPQWDEETVYVDRTGEIIDRQPVTAKYYEEKIPLNKKSRSRNQPIPEQTQIRMLLIPGGTLLKEGKTITIKPFFMSQTPITQAQWWAIAQRKDLKIKNDLNPIPSQFNKDYQETSHWLRPVEKVSWYDAIEYCGRLAKLTQLRYALPSEAQWEYACHGLRQPPNPYPPFHYGETLTGELANYNSQETHADEEKMTSPRQTTPVGSYPPNAFGLQDMHGNVWEWCMDLWDAEEKPIDDNSINLLDNGITIQLLSDESRRAIRGGSWFDYPAGCRSALRDWIYPDYRYYYYGFRVVCRFPRL
jgi:formylglycine-generating enzyme required for sulfatase activity